MADERTGKVAGILLAAGTSSRMGRNKLLLDFDGQSLLRRTAERALEAGLDPLVVVLGHERNRAREVVADLDVRIALNDDLEAGKSHSVRVGIDALPGDAAAAVVILADMPFVTAGMIATLVDRYRSGTTPLVASRYGDVNAPPILYDRSLFEELSTMRDGGCGKAVVKAHRAEAEFVSWPEEALMDVDAPEDLKRARAALFAS